MSGKCLVRLIILAQVLFIACGVVIVPSLALKGAGIPMGIFGGSIAASEPCTDGDCPPPPCTDGDCPPPPCTDGDCPQEIAVDIKPGSCPNSFNVKEKGVLPVAILGTGNLDIRTIDPASIALTRAGVFGEAKPVQWSVTDTGAPSGTTCSCGKGISEKDLFPDLILKFKAQDVVNQLGIKKGEGCIQVMVKGSLKNPIPGIPGTLIEGSDFLRIL